MLKIYFLLYSFAILTEYSLNYYQSYKITVQKGINQNYNYLLQK
jgi:hypothetical protein